MPERDALIEEFHPLAIKISKRRFPGNEDAESQAVLGMLVAIDRYFQYGLPHDNLGGYVVKYILQYLYKTTPTESPEHREPATTSPDTVMVKDLIDYIIKGPFDRTVIEMRLQGYTDQEIADELGYSKAYAYQLRQQLQVRLTDARKLD